jgi:hypothetical protein
VRGADVAYYSYARLPKGPLSAGYGPEIPELVVEVRSENDRWPEIIEMVIVDPTRRPSAFATAVQQAQRKPQTAERPQLYARPSPRGPDCDRTWQS